ncbi:MAG: hypothetical protein AAF581_20980 [Planctomycetota bacterium]
MCKKVCWIMLAAAMLTGCKSLEEHLAWGGDRPPDERRDFLADLAMTVGELPKHDPSAEADRQMIDRFLVERFATEEDVVARSQILSLALQGEFPCATALVTAAVDPEQPASVRHTAVKGLRELSIAGRKQLLLGTLANDSDAFVRIDAVKVIAAVGDASWARPVVEVIVDPSENSSLRFQSHRTANQLLGTDLPYLPSKWKAWLETN